MTHLPASLPPRIPAPPHPRPQRSTQLRLCILLLLPFGMAFAGYRSAAVAQPVPPLPTCHNTAALPPAEIRRLIQQARDAWVNEDADAFAMLFADDGEFIVHGERWVGQEPIRQVAASFAAGSTNVVIEIRRIIVEGNHAAVEWYWENTDDATGQRQRADDVILVDFVNGRIQRWREYIDRDTPAAFSDSPSEP